MGLSDYIKPKPVAKTMGIILFLSVAIDLLQTHPEIPQLIQTWSWFMDLVALTSLAITLVILTDLNHIQKQYHFRANAPELLNNLYESREELYGMVSSDFDNSKQEIKRTLRRTRALLKHVKEILPKSQTEVEEDVEEDIERLHNHIDTYLQSNQRDENKVYDIWGEIDTIETHLEQLINQSEWTRI